MKKLVLLVVLVGFTFLFTGTAFGDIINVPTAEYPTIQAGIDAASSGDTVQVAAGTYYENITMKSDVVIQGAGQGISIIDGGGSGSVVTAIDVDSTATLDGFTITNGVSGAGGGMYNYQSSPSVTNCIFLGNSGAGGGGGMYNYYSSPTVESCTFSGNTSANNGGGMYNYYSSPAVENCAFLGNISDLYGGGMRNNNSSPTVTNCSFYDNSAAYWGGGMYNTDYSSPTLESCTFSENTASKGGGMYTGINSSPGLINCTFSGNSATMGGGMFNTAFSSGTVTNCIFSENSASLGGGINNDHASQTLTNCTFSGNSAVLGGGMYNESSSSPTVTNNILWGDSPSEIYNASSSSPSVAYSDIQGGFTGTGNIDADPKFVDAANEDYHLQQGSPCIDTGTPSGAPATDLEGNPRPQGAGYDMGAYEFLLAKTTAMPWILLLLGD